eukprot:10705401-Ditylum_brightwellii.AAC.1
MDNIVHNKSNTKMMVNPYSGIKTQGDKVLEPLTPRSRVQNGHNAVYGQHLLNSFNSPGCAAKVIGDDANYKEADDALFASLYVDQLIDQHERQKKEKSPLLEVKKSASQSSNANRLEQEDIEFDYS